MTAVSYVDMIKVLAIHYNSEEIKKAEIALEVLKRSNFPVNVIEMAWLELIDALIAFKGCHKNFKWNVSIKRKDTDS